MPTLSIIIPSYGSSHLSAVIDALRPLEPLQIIVVDSSSEKPAPIAGVTLIHLSQQTAPGKARNEGARRARGDYLLFVDADVVFSSVTRTAVRAWIERETKATVCGLYDTRAEDSFATRLHNAVLAFRLFGRAGAATPLKSSSHFLMPRTEFIRVGGFNEEIESYEDVEFFTRCERLGVSMLTDPSLCAAHLKQYTAASVLADYFRKAHNAFLVRKRYPNLWHGSGLHLGWPIAITWMIAALLPLIALASAWQPAVGIPAMLAALASPSALWPTLLRQQPLAFKLRALLLWPIIGNAVAAGTLIAVVRWLGGRISDTTLAVADWGRAGFRVVLRTGMPVQIINYVTARCNLRCEHCFYKETLDAPDPGELSLATIDKATRGIGPVLWYSLAGGEPFIRKDLKALIDIIDRNCRPKVLSFPTNGWYVQRTFDTTLRVLQSLRHGNLILFFSLDGPQQTHDRIRGEHSFARVRETMDRLRPLQTIYPNLYLNVITTVTAENAHETPDFIDELVRDFRPNAISINLFRYHSLEHPPVPDAVIEGYRATVERYSRHLRNNVLQHYGFVGRRILMIKEILQKEMIYRIAKHDEFITPCTAGTLSYVIMEDGRVTPCEILPDSIGTIASAEPSIAFSRLARGKRARDLRRWIRDTKCKCTYECAQTTNTLFSWPMSGRLAWQFSRSLAGLDKPAPPFAK